MLLRFMNFIKSMRKKEANKEVLDEEQLFEKYANTIQNVPFYHKVAGKEEPQITDVKTYSKQMISDFSQRLESHRNFKDLVVIQALWDGDTQGWFLCLDAVFRIKGAYTEENLKGMRFGSDIRIFNGQVPPYPESEVAKLVGNILAEKYNIIFYFPSPDLPDDDCPRYWEQHRAIKCADCGKLVIPSDSPYLPKDVCYHCHLERKSIEKIVKDEKLGGANVYMDKENEYHSYIYSLNLKNSLLFSVLKKVSQKEDEFFIKQIIYIVENEELAGVFQFIEHELDTKLTNYKPFECEIKEGEEKNFERMIKHEKKFDKIFEFTLKGKAYTLTINRLNERELYDLVSLYRDIQELIDKKEKLLFLFKGNLTYRGERFIYFLGKREKATFEDFVNEYGKFLSKDEIQKTLDNLISLNFLKQEGNSFLIGQNGSFV